MTTLQYQPSSEELSPETPSCTEKAHHWVIAPPNAPTSDGQCKHCRISKTFFNSITLDTWRSKWGPSIKEPSSREENIVEEYNGGMEISDLADKHTIALNTVYYILRKHNVTLRRKAQFAERDEKMAERYDAGDKVSEIAKDQNPPIAADTAYRAIRKYKEKASKEA